MASVHREIELAAPAEAVWDAVRDVGAVHERLTPGVVVDTRLEGDERVVTFETGSVVRELIVDLDDHRRRLAYAVIDSPLAPAHFNASMQVLREPQGQSRLVWDIDVLPHELAEPIAAIVEQGAAAMRHALAVTSRS